MSSRSVTIAVEDGGVPAALLGPEDASGAPALVVIPSIYGAAPDLLRRLSELADRALIVCPDPFWRLEPPGVVAYADRDTAFGRLKAFELRQCIADLGAVVDWAAARSKGRVVGLGICFGGPFVLRFASEQRLDGVVTWHGSRMEQHLERAAKIRCPLRLHFGADDAVTPPEAIDAIRAALVAHPDCEIAVHPGLEHGFSHDGPAYDEGATRAGLDSLDELLERCRQPA